MKLKSLALSTALAIAIGGASLQASSHEVETDSQNLTIIYAGTLLAVPGKQPLTDQTIHISDGKITKLKTDLRALIKRAT